MSARWHSVHVYHQAADELLVTAVRPLVASLRARGAIDGFFFLRYWERGFHVRLRFALVEDVRAEIDAALRAYLAAHPSERSVDEASYRDALVQLARLEGRTDVVELAPNDSLAVEPYQPELAKYGGERGVAIAEALFDRSAACVLEILPAIAGNERRRHGVGLAMMVQGIRAFGLGDVPQFLRGYQRMWRDYVPATTQRPVDDALRARIRALPDGQSGPFRIWRDAVAAAAAALTRDADRVLPHVRADVDARAFLLAQYLHVNNNRLGLIPADEHELAGLGHAALEAA